jgi:hypothetical protein
MSVKNDIKSALAELAQRVPPEQKQAIEKLSKALVKLAKQVEGAA